jgi:hypothetical protein
MKQGQQAGCGQKGEVGMTLASKRVWCVVPLIAFGPLVLPADTQPPAAGTKVVQVTGLAGIKNKTSGRLAVEGGNLHFSHEQTKVDVAASSVEDVVTGNDSQRLVHGALGTLTMFAPYESGRFLSLFRTKLDTLTIKYRDADGGLHGAVFTMGVGKAEALKKELLGQGAHTTVPTEVDANQTPVVKEEKP